MNAREFFWRFQPSYNHELIFGFIRPAVRLSPEHSMLVERVRVLLAAYLAEQGTGVVLGGRLDVVLDDDEDIVLHPPLVVLLGCQRYVRTRNRVWGVPDIVLEVLTPETSRRIRSNKVRWYRERGVRECWLPDPKRKQFEVLKLQGRGSITRVFAGQRTMRSAVLPRFRLKVGHLFSPN